MSEPVLREALRGLAERHPSLCAKLCDPFQLYTATQRAFTIFELWRRCDCPGMHPSLAAAVCRGTRWAFRRAWPRACSAPPEEPPLTVLPHSETAEQAKTACKFAEFWPPFQSTLAAYGADGGEEGAFLSVQVSHMFSDGYSIVPILSDLGHLIAKAESAALPPLAPVPNAMAVLEQRLMRTINGDDSMNDLISPEPLSQSWTRDKCVFFSPVSEKLVSALKRCARNLGVSTDIAVLAAICVGLAHLENKGTLTVVLVAPLRDGPAEGDLVGLLADFRVLQVSVEGLSVAGVALQLHCIVKERRWQRPGLTTQWDWPWVNFQWTDMEAHHGLRQVVDLSRRTEMLRTPVGIVAEQPDARSWRLRTSFDRRCYFYQARERYFHGLVLALEALVLNPLVPAWPAANSSSQV
uniref:Condensation domain-containing protein n=1 Tax=Alexandrium catenella TaxID=2925 RepID=A0A7S1WAJ8_ALECA